MLTLMLTYEVFPALGNINTRNNYNREKELLKREVTSCSLFFLLIICHQILLSETPILILYSYWCFQEHCLHLIYFLRRSHRTKYFAMFHFNWKSVNIKLILFSWWLCQVILLSSFQKVHFPPKIKMQTKLDRVTKSPKCPI